MQYLDGKVILSAPVIVFSDFAINYKHKLITYLASQKNHIYVQGLKTENPNLTLQCDITIEMWTKSSFFCHNSSCF